MSVYFVANIKVNERQEYEKYLEVCDEVFAKYSGEYLAVDEKPVILEGDWNYSKVVLIRFPSETDLRRWYESAEYQKILKSRLSSAQCDTLIVKGIKITAGPGTGNNKRLEC
jgi:uncharacterized protein (DUF1330 family)